MKFFHVYNEDCFKGLEKNGLLNKDTGFKIQHAFPMPAEKKFNQFAAKGTKFFNMIKEGNIPFYVDRIAGGVTWHNYDFDKDLIRTYREMLGDWFLGFQLHESGSNRRNSEWPGMIKRMGHKGPYDLEELKAKSLFTNKWTPEGQKLYMFSQDTPEYYSTKKYAETYQEYFEEMKELFSRRMADTDGAILPVDSYFMATKLQLEMGMKTFMPEVGSQIPCMRVQIALARGIAENAGKTWGAYYECWRELPHLGYVMPCFNDDPSNEWFMPQSMHGDDFSSYGPNGGSSRPLQNRIYYYALMSGADYFGEEWGLNCSYDDMQDFTLSPYGECKKSFINNALNLRGVKAKRPIAIVLPSSYSVFEILEPYWVPWQLGDRRTKYLRSPLSLEESKFFGHVEDVLKLVFAKHGGTYGNEGHVITNSRFGDQFDIIYADSSDEVFAKYDYLIDATPDSQFAKKKGGSFKVLESTDVFKLEKDLKDIIPNLLDVYVDDLCWLVSTDDKNRRLLSIFNNEGNERNIRFGDTIDNNADRVVNVTFKEAAEPKVLVNGYAPAEIEKVSDKSFRVKIPAASFAIFEF